MICFLILRFLILIAVFNYIPKQKIDQQTLLFVSVISMTGLYLVDLFITPSRQCEAMTIDECGARSYNKL